MSSCRKVHDGEVLDIFPVKGVFDQPLGCLAQDRDGEEAVRRSGEGGKGGGDGTSLDAPEADHGTDNLLPGREAEALNMLVPAEVRHRPK